jgi:translation initiation factor IF-2
MVIRVPRSGNIAGSYVTNGVIRRGARARLTRDGREVYKGSIAQLRRFKDDVREVGAGFECGINLQNYDNVQEGDVIEAYEMVEVPAG